MITTKGKYLITTDGWFLAPDGEQYCSVWGEAEMITTKDAFDFNPTRSTNWFLRVGGESEGSLVIAGCQVHYAVKCEQPPVFHSGGYTDKDTGRLMAFNKIYMVKEQPAEPETTTYGEGNHNTATAPKNIL